MLQEIIKSYKEGLSAKNISSQFSVGTASSFTSVRPQMSD